MSIDPGERGVVGFVCVRGVSVCVCVSVCLCVRERGREKLCHPRGSVPCVCTMYMDSAERERERENVCQ